jgi:F-type H+-transporting ATPase subunit O
VYEDMKYIQELYRHCDSFRYFTQNAGVGGKEVAQLNQALRETAPFSETTLHFLTVLAENKRLIYIEEITKKYSKLYQEFNKEEKITIISAHTLTGTQ